MEKQRIGMQNAFWSVWITQALDRNGLRKDYKNFTTKKINKKND